MLSRGGGSISVVPWYSEAKLPYKQAPIFIFSDYYRAKLDNSSILLYIYLYNLSQLSYENSKTGKYWINRSGEVFVHCTLETVQQILRCGHDKAAKVLKELEHVELIKKVSRGNGRPAEIVLLPPKVGIEESAPAASEKPNLGIEEPVSAASEKTKLGHRENRSLSSGKTDTNHTDKAIADKISANHPPQNMSTREEVEEKIKDNISYDILLSEFPDDCGTLEVILDAMINTICAKDALVKIGKQEYDREKVRERFYAIDDMDIRYVIDKIRDMEQPIKYLAGFCVARLYNAKNESDSYYESKFRRDLAAGKL